MMLSSNDADSSCHFFCTLAETKAGGIGAHNLKTRWLQWPPSTSSGSNGFLHICDKEVNMSDIDEKLIVKLGQRLSEQNELLRMIAESLRGVEAHLLQIAVSSNPAPNYQRPLSEYPTFDWSSIGAIVLNRDDDGVTAVEWNGQVFTRRSPSNKFAEAVWFSRHLGQDSDGNNRYARLISFKALSDAEPIAAKAKKAIRAY
jgi:DdrB-like protein